MTTNETTLTWTKQTWLKSSQAYRSMYLKHAISRRQDGALFRIVVKADVYERYLRMVRSANPDQYGK